MLRLRPYKNCDADIIASWIKNEYAFRQWCADRYDRYPISGADINAHYAVLRFGFVIVDVNRRGEGYGREMLSLALQYAALILKAEKVTLGVFENNPAAYHCYRAAGFQDVPTEQAEYYHVLGENWKCLEMERTL